MADTGSSHSSRLAESRSSRQSTASLTVPYRLGSSVIPTSNHSDAASLSRHGTLLSTRATPLRRAAELKSLLGNVNSRLHPGAKVLHHLHRQEPTSLEQARPRARVEIDIAMQSNICIEGGAFSGCVKLRIRPRLNKETAISIGDPKLRIIGFESTEGDHHEFYQHSAALDEVATSSVKIYSSPPDVEGFCLAREGVHKVEFEMDIPVKADSRPKGIFRGQAGVGVRYIALVSIKIKDERNKRSIAHFYRDCEVYPRLNPSLVLAPAEELIQAAVSKTLFMGGKGELRLVAGLHREHFIAGTQVSVSIGVQNDTKKIIKSLTLTLHRTTVVYKRSRRHDLDSASNMIDLNTPQTTITEKVMAASTLEMAQGFPRGHASTLGWWSGVPGGESTLFSHLLLIPPDALTHSREELIEVKYSIRVSLNGGGPLGTDMVYVTLPIRIISLLSLDPPPSFNLLAQDSSVTGGLPRAPSAAPLAPIPRSGSSNNSVELDSPTSEHREAYEDPYGSEYSQDGEQLGNLSMGDDVEDLVHHAILSAQRNKQSVESEHPLEQTAEESEDSTENEPENQEPGTDSQQEKHGSNDDRPKRIHGPSSFRRRVHQKLRLGDAANVRQPLLPDNLSAETALAPMSETGGASLLKENAAPKNAFLHVPATQSAILPASGYEIASSSFLDSRYSGSTPSLPSPIVGLPFPDTSPKLSHVSGTLIGRLQEVNDDRSTSQSRKASPTHGMYPKRPSIALAATSAGSVKDRIRELEERVRATGGY